MQMLLSQGALQFFSPPWQSTSKSVGLEMELVLCLIPLGEGGREGGRERENEAGCTLLMHRQV